MSHKKSIPCYLPNGGGNNIVNVPFGIFTRVELKILVGELLKNLQLFETMLVAKATERNVKLLRGLDAFLAMGDLKPKSKREAAQNLLAENEKNLKQNERDEGTGGLNLVDFSIKCGLIALCYLITAHLEYCQNIN